MKYKEINIVGFYLQFTAKFDGMLEKVIYYFPSQIFKESFICSYLTEDESNKAMYVETTDRKSSTPYFCMTFTMPIFTKLSLTQ